MEQTVIYLLMVQKLYLNSKQKILKFYTSFMFKNISKDFSANNIKRLDFMDMFMIFVLITMLWQLMIYYAFASNEKEL